MWTNESPHVDVLADFFSGDYHHRVEHWESKVVIFHKCEKYGHIAKNCTSETNVCAKCSENHLTSECYKPRNEKKCASCGAICHGAWNLKCPKLLEQQRYINPMFKEIQIIKKERKENEKARQEEIRTIGPSKKQLKIHNNTESKKETSSGSEDDKQNLIEPIT
jgi:hypothetical protein